MEFIKDYFKNRTLGFWLAFGGAALALVSSVAYLIVYLATAGDAIDRVFSPLTFAFMLAGSLTALAAERLGFKFGQLVPAALYAVAVAYHWMQSMYPMADAARGELLHDAGSPRGVKDRLTNDRMRLRAHRARGALSALPLLLIRIPRRWTLEKSDTTIFVATGHEKRAAGGGDTRGRARSGV